MNTYLSDFGAQNIIGQKLFDEPSVDIPPATIEREMKDAVDKAP